MKTIASKAALLSLLLPTLCSGSNYVRERRLSYKTFDAFVPFPDDALPILNKTVAMLMPMAPKVTALVNLPSRIDLFGQMIEPVVRNSYQQDLWHMDVMYVMGDGLDIGCRVATNGATSNSSDERVRDHSPVEKNQMCQTHCTHKGRYCPIFKDHDLAGKSYNGRDLVMEILRRTCLGYVLPYKFADNHWFEYLTVFHDHKCMDAPQDLTQCSNTILQTHLLGFPTGEGSAFAQCVKEVEADTDTTNDVLEKALDWSHKAMKEYGYNDISELDVELPDMRYNGEKWSTHFWHHPRADHVLGEWCKFFKGDLKPVSCDFCHTCSYQKDCLWYLSCDRNAFDINTYHDPKHFNDKKKNETTIVYIEKEVVKGTGEVMGFGIAIGVGGALVLWIMVELKRRRAVKEVASELPVNGFKDGGAADDVELPPVA